MKKLTLVAAALILALFCFVSQDIPVQAQTLGPLWSCSLDNIGATLTLCSKAQGTKMLYITDIVAQSTTSTAGLMLLETGTGTDCGTGTAALYPSAAAVARLVYTANTAAPTALHFQSPIAVRAGLDLCVIGTATNTVTIQMQGFTK
jgi:hypothetical protein